MKHIIEKLRQQANRKQSNVNFWFGYKQALSDMVRECSEDKMIAKADVRTEDEAALDAAYRYESVLSKQIWNEAIEAAAVVCRYSGYAPEIRKLKK